MPERERERERERNGTRFLVVPHVAWLVPQDAANCGLAFAAAQLAPEALARLGLPRQAEARGVGGGEGIARLGG